MCTHKNKNEYWTFFSLFYKLRTSKDLEILRQSSFMSHILKVQRKRNTHISHIALFDKDKWHKRCSNAYLGVLKGGGQTFSHFSCCILYHMPQLV